VLTFWVVAILRSIFGENCRAETRWGTLIAAPMAKIGRI
jgi:hypothetical protein